MAVDSILIFIHIAKTAGTSLNYTLEREFFHDRTLGVYEGIMGSVCHSGTGVYEPEAVAQRYFATEYKEKIEFISGHMRYGLHEFLDKSSSYITFVREPVARIVSAYNYVLSVGFLPSGSTINDFLDYDFLGNSDAMVRQLVHDATLDARSSPTTRREHARPVTQDDYDAALAAIDERFVFAAPTSRYDEAAFYLARKYGWPLELLLDARSNVSPKTLELKDVPPFVRERIREVNKWDARLFAACSERFSQKINALPDSERALFNVMVPLFSAYGKYCATYHYAGGGCSARFRRLVREIERMALHPVPEAPDPGVATPDTQFVDEEMASASAQARGADNGGQEDPKAGFFPQAGPKVRRGIRSMVQYFRSRGKPEPACVRQQGYEGSSAVLRSEFDVLVFLHIAKTAGTSIGQIFMRMYQPDECLCGFSRTRITALGMTELAEMKAFASNAGPLSSVRFSGGHICYGIHGALPDKRCLYFTVLREPVERALSNFYYVVRKNIVPGCPPDLTLEDYLDRGAPHLWFSNAQLRALSDDPAVNGTGLSIMDDISQCKKIQEEDYLRVLKLVSGGTMLVGTVDMLHESIVLLAGILHVPLNLLVFGYENVNPNRPTVESIDTSRLQQIRDYNLYDQGLYEYAKKIIVNNIMLLGDSFSHDVEAFRSLCATFNSGVPIVDLPETFVTWNTSHRSL